MNYKRRNYDDDYTSYKDDDYMDYEYDNENYNDDSYTAYQDDYKDMYNDSYDEFEYEKKKYKSINTIFDDDEEDNDITANEEADVDADLMKSMDNDLAGYFSDARLFAPKKKLVDTMKKKPKRVIHKAGARINTTINKQNVTGIVLFGPYESNKKQMYQLELDSGEIIEAEEKKIHAE